MKLTNQYGINLATAVWLVHDEYDRPDVDNYISATSLMKPIRMTALANRHDLSDQSVDIHDLVRTSIGHAIHDSAEKAWTKGYARALKALGYPDNVIQRVRINPSVEEMQDTNIIPVWLEQRAIKPVLVDGKLFHVGGKFDFACEGILQDYKSTSVYAWIAGSREEEHKLQGSIYRWLHPDKITEDFIRINYIFTDFKQGEAQYRKEYPPHRVPHADIPLMSIQETEQWVISRLREIHKASQPNATIPECTDEELWRSETQYKYFSDPNKVNVAGARATKNCESLAEAKELVISKGKGAIKVVPGEPKRCEYCSVFAVCDQKDRYFGNP